MDDKLNWGEISRYRGEIYGISMIWIMWFHVQEWCPKATLWTHSLGSVLNNGNIGVDVFLFVSGISLYFSMKREGSIWSFYKKRVKKILPVYFLLALPYMIWQHLIFEHDVRTFMMRIFFIDKGHNNFWFLLCIMVCYAFYPLIFHLLEREDRRGRILFMVSAAAVLFSLCYFQSEFFLRYNISLGRYPVFFLGCLAGPLVYERRDISPILIASCVLFLFVSKDICNKCGAVFAWSSATRELIARLRMGLQGVGSIFVLLPFLRILSRQRLGGILRFLGGWTLELYVIHIIVGLTVLELAFRGGISRLAERELFFVLLFLITSLCTFLWGRCHAVGIKWMMRCKSRQKGSY